MGRAHVSGAETGTRPLPLAALPHLAALATCLAGPHPSPRPGRPRRNGPTGRAASAVGTAWLRVLALEAETVLAVAGPATQLLLRLRAAALAALLVG